MPPDFPLLPEELCARLFRRARILFIGDDDDGWTLTHEGQDGDAGTVHLHREQAWALAMAILASSPWRFSWKDHEDQVLMGILLRWYGSGVPFADVDPAIRSALSELLDRNEEFLERLAALLPSRR